MRPPCLARWLGSLKYFASDDHGREVELRAELLALGAKAIEEAHRESALVPPSRGGRSQRQRATRLSSLDPALVSVCGRLFGLDYGSAGEEVASRLIESTAASNGNRSFPVPWSAREALVRYYDAESLGAGELGPYVVDVNGFGYQAAIATRRRWTGLSIPLAPLGGTHPTEVCRLAKASARIADGDEFRARGLDFLCDIEARGLEIYDAPIFRLRRMGVRSDSFEADFALDSFVRYRFTIGLLAEELGAALELGGSETVLADRERWLPLRGRFLSDGAALARPSSRICSGGVLTLTAIARGHRGGDFLLLVQRRSPRVSDAHGLLSVIPKAFHQPIGFLHDAALQKEVMVSSTLYRELFEEVLGGREVEVSGRELEPEWYVQGSKPLRWLRDRPDSYGAWCIGLGFNLLSGNYEVGTMLVIHDPRFWNAFEHQLRPNWEVDHLMPVTTAPAGQSNDELQMAAVLGTPELLEGWTSEGLFVLVEGIARLKALHPARTPLPGLRLRRLVPKEEDLV